ncbi:IucA/IucC family siderophore biosynthesis protein, partial [Streptomyces beijiangensis]|nr:IucA/IucC family siderophore biosynthesis protein [Streptomyces beijiangensis]
MLAAFAYEELIEPVPFTTPNAGDRHAMRLDDDSVLTFRARRGSYGHWHIAPDSIEVQGQPFGDPLQFLVRARRVLALDGATLGHLVRELTTTLAADARLDHTALSVADLVELGYAQLEGHQTGHPWLVLNKGRVGFSATDAARWTPEARRPSRLPWIAVSTALASYRGVSGLATPDRLYHRELDAPTRASFAA